MYQVLIVFSFVLVGCQFDSSAYRSSADAGVATTVDASGVSGADGDQPAPETPCSQGLSRTCGECGTESCVDGAWSGECVGNDTICDYGTLCLPDGAGTQNCQAACSTEGHRTPYDWGLGLGDSIPNVIDVGDYWISTDGCNYPGDYRVCECEYSGNSGDPRVHCHHCQSEEDW